MAGALENAAELVSQALPAISMAENPLIVRSPGKSK
jgi:hypothetical protein